MNGPELKVMLWVRTNFHRWKRAGEVGRIVAHEPERGASAFLVQFETRYPGGGMDGDKLWLEANQLTVIDHPGDQE
jgi:hypothetical protein